MSKPVWVPLNGREKKEQSLLREPGRVGGLAVDQGAFSQVAL